MVWWLGSLASLCCWALQSHIKARVKAISICLCLLLHSSQECVMWPRHVQAGCVFPFRCTLTSAHELETLLLSSLFRSLSDEHRTSSWPVHSKTRRVQIPGRINARLSWINIIQTCSIPARLSQRVYKKMPEWMRIFFSQLRELWKIKQELQFVFWVDLVFINCISFYCS